MCSDRRETRNDSTNATKMELSPIVFSIDGGSSTFAPNLSKMVTANIGHGFGTLTFHRKSSKKKKKVNQTTKPHTYC